MASSARLTILVGVSFFFFNDTATTEIYTLSLHDALPIWGFCGCSLLMVRNFQKLWMAGGRSEEHTSELQSLRHVVCRLLLEKKKKKQRSRPTTCASQSHHHRLTRHVTV